MKLGSILAGVLVCSFVGVVACGESDEDKAKAAAARTEAEEQDEFLNTYCQIVLPCCNRLLLKSREDIAGCKAHLRQIDSVTIANKEARETCLTQTRAVAGEPTFCTDFAHMDTQACPDPHRAKLVGTKKLGEVCDKVDECAPDFTGVVDCVGVCQVRKRGKEGDGPCDRTIDGDVTLPLVEASTEGTVFTCYAKGANGTTCDTDTKKCVVAVADREACTASTQCTKGSYCDRDEKKCFPRLVKDSKCDVDDECKGYCKASEDTGGGGDDDDEGIGGFCVDKVGDGESCVITSYCEEGLECVSGACTPPPDDARLAATCVP